MAHPPARWTLASAALPLLAGLALIPVTLRALDKPGWDALGYAVLAVLCGGLALLLCAVALLLPGWDALTRAEAGIATAAAAVGTSLLVFGLLAWILDGDSPLLLVADLAGLAVAGPALVRGIRRLRRA